MDQALKLQKIREDFILVDLICHGVPSQRIWTKYLEELDRKYSERGIYDVRFRDKRKSWQNFSMRIVSNEGKINYRRSGELDLFYQFFLAANCYMESCYECNYRTRSAADLRIGDYWGPRFVKNKKGVSMALALTMKGNALLENLKALGRIVLEPHNCKEYWTTQYPVNPIKPVYYDSLMHDLRCNSTSLAEMDKEYCRASRIKRRVSHLARPLISIMRKLL